MITLKHKKETEKELAHTDVYSDGKYLGYFMPNKSTLKEVGENWNFVSKCEDVQYFHAKTKNELLDTLTKQINKEPVKLKQHFGLTTELNIV